MLSPTLLGLWCREWPKLELVSSKTIIIFLFCYLSGAMVLGLGLEPCNCLLIFVSEHYLESIRLMG